MACDGPEAPWWPWPFGRPFFGYALPPPGRSFCNVAPPNRGLIAEQGWSCPRWEWSWGSQEKHRWRGGICTWLWRLNRLGWAWIKKLWLDPVVSGLPEGGLISREWCDAKYSVENGQGRREQKQRQPGRKQQHGNGPGEEEHGLPLPLPHWGPRQVNSYL